MSLPLGDARFTLRLLWKDKSFSLAALLTLTLCLGANTALFSIVYSVLLRPLPVPEPDRLVVVYNSYPKAGADRSGSGVPDYDDRVRGVRAIETLALFEFRNRNTGEAGRPERALCMGVTPSFFRVAGVQPQLGRTFTEGEAEVGREDKIVLSHRWWQEQYSGDPHVIGRQMRLDGRPFTIVGVMPPRFEFIEPSVRLWIPLAFPAQMRADDARHNNSWQSVGRLRPGATVGEAQAQVDAINAANLERLQVFKQILLNTGYHTVVAPLQEDLVRDVKARLYLLWAGTIFVLLIGCVNVINLTLVRARARLREIATRIALGAGRLRVTGQMVTESLLLTSASAVAGLLLGWAVLRLLATVNLDRLPRAGEIHLSAAAAAFTLALAAVLGIVIAVFPVATVLGVDSAAVLHEGGRTGTGGRGARLLRRALVVAQVAVAFVLLVGAGLLVASFRQILSIDPGFDPHQVMTASVSLPRARYTPERAGRFPAEALRQIRALPGVEGAGVTSSIPFGDDHSNSVIFAEGYQMQPGESVISPGRVDVTPGYFEAMRIPLRRGRFFDDRDTRTSQHVVIVDERLARKFWPDKDPVGRRMFRPTDMKDPLGTNEKTDWLTVVGVVGEIKQEALVSSQQPVGAYYFPYEQEPDRTMTFAVRTSADPAMVMNGVRRAVAAIDPELPLFAPKTMDEWTADSLMTRRWPMLLSMGFGVVALLLSAVGIYGVLAYLVTQRTKEIGIRMAIGGTPRSIFDLVVKEGAGLLGIGLALGAAGAFAVRRSIESQLYAVRPTDPRVLVLVTLLLGFVALVACCIPARRATRIDPVVALNRE